MNPAADPSAAQAAKPWVEVTASDPARCRRRPVEDMGTLREWAGVSLRRPGGTDAHPMGLHSAHAAAAWQRLLQLGNAGIADGAARPNTTIRERSSPWAYCLPAWSRPR
jgi:hypothetical protein